MNYYNSELSEFIGTQCKRIMTSIDVDILQVKTSKNILRFIESKHINEKLGDQQEKALKTLGWLANIINKNSAMFGGKKIQVYLVRGNRPYENIEIFDFVTYKKYKISGIEKVKKFLEVDYELNDIDKI